MIYTFIKHVVTDSGEFTSSKTFNEFDKALIELHTQASNNIADVNVKRFDAVILNDALIQCSQPVHYTRPEPEPQPEVVEEVAEAV